MLPLALVSHWLAASATFLCIAALFFVTTRPFRAFGQGLMSPRWRSARSASLVMAVGLSNATMDRGDTLALAAVGYRLFCRVSAFVTPQSPLPLRVSSTRGRS